MRVGASAGRTAAHGTGRTRRSARPPGRSARCCRRSRTGTAASSEVPICCCAPRSSRSMNGSPAICSEKRVQRWHSTQRSRSSSTLDEIATGFGNVRLISWKRDSARPLLIAWFCSGHSPPLSQIGQSSGWLISSSSITPCCALSATGGGQLGLDHHAGHHGRGARRGGLGHAAAVAHVGDLDQALAAGAGRVEQRVVAEARDLDAELLGGPDQQRALGHGDLEAVDGDGDEVFLRRSIRGHSQWASCRTAASQRGHRGTGSPAPRRARGTRRGST